MIEITKAYTVGSVKARNSLFVWCREREKKNKDYENVFFKPLANRFRLTLKSCLGSKKLFMADLLSNGLHEKVMICCWK